MHASRGRQEVAAIAAVRSAGDSGALMGQSAARPGGIVLGTSKSEPAHFAGRRRELAELARTYEYVSASGKPAGGLVLVSGVQGVGKTQLVEHFVKTSSLARLALTTNDLEGLPEELFVWMMRAVGRERRAAKLAGLTGKLTGIGVPGVQLRAERPRGRRTLGHFLAQSKDRGWWRGRALVVTIDELQKVTAGQRDTLGVLHEGAHGAPIMLLCAGLQHTADRLGATLRNPDGTENTGAISRFAEIRLAPLARSETREAIERGLQRLDITPSAEQIEVLAAQAMDFPQHIHGYLEGVWEAMAGRSGAPGEREFEVAVRRGDEARAAFYEQRLRGTLDAETIPGLAVAMDRQQIRELRWKEAAAVLAEMGAEDPDAALQSALEHGVLTTDPRRRVSFGIPSFHDYMSTLHARDRPPSAAS